MADFESSHFWLNLLAAFATHTSTSSLHNALLNNSEFSSGRQRTKRSRKKTRIFRSHFCSGPNSRFCSLQYRRCGSFYSTIPSAGERFVRRRTFHWFHCGKPLAEFLLFCNEIAGQFSLVLLWFLPSAEFAVRFVYVPDLYTIMGNYYGAANVKCQWAIILNCMFEI